MESSTAVSLGNIPLRSSLERPKCDRDRRTSNCFARLSGRHSLENISGQKHTMEAEAIDSSLRRKDEGNALFRADRFEESIVCYTDAIEIIDNVNGCSCADVLMTLYNNRATALFKLKRYTESVADADRAIRLSLRGAKAYFRKAVSSAYLGHYLIAIGNACVAHQLDPSTNEKCKSTLQECFPNSLDLDSYQVINVKANMGRSALNTAMINSAASSNVVFIVEGGTYDCRPLNFGQCNIVIMGLGIINLVHISSFPAISAKASSGYLFNICIEKSESHAFLCQNSEFYLDRCTFNESKEAAIAVDLRSKVFLRYVNIERCVGSGVLANRGAEVHIESSNFTDSSRQALEVRGGARITAIGNTFSRNDKGVLCWKGAEYLRLYRNIFAECTSDSEGVLLSENTEALIE